MHIKRGLRLHYVENGNESLPLLVLLHGFPECWLTWRHQLKDLRTEFRVVAIDLPGYGDSDKPARKDAYKVEELTENIKQFLLEMGVTSKRFNLTYRQFFKALNKLQ